ncbi:2-C-methyl-D-erythritol 2,4-cyclodiphosphate synthase [Ignavibacteria bacterium]|nr:2-C-methyl-D-erythritol 2,4-cyclodiphosphate synthase [Bacteroidota bacterium]MCZ2133690.1 2-C-methyl-D-erythritol 2,4-cyclodiphosphate synthase [Bacteroidota bacterium]
MTGFGYDIHRFTDTGTGFMLGGVWIPAQVSVIAHSDGDVAIHALCDALLGAAGLGDIGEHFPDSDLQFRNAASAIFLQKTMEILAKDALRPINIDISIVLEQPKISPYKEEMRRILANLCRLDIRRVSIKATTNERVGCIGRSEAVAAFAVCQIEYIEN